MIITKHTQAFTLLEAIIALAVITMVFAAGVSGVMRIRYSIELQNAYSETISYIEDLQNKAQNGAASSAFMSATPDLFDRQLEKTPDFHAIYFYTFNFMYRVCKKTGANLDQVLCYTEVNPGLKIDGTSPLRFTVQSNTGVNCGLIGFERRTADIKVLPYLSGTTIADATPGNNIICTITVTHSKLSGVSKKIEIDLEANTIDFE